MILQKSPNKWSCLPTAVAMAIGVPVESLIRDIGHDGSQIIFPELKDPFCRRGFDFTDISLALLKHRLSCTILHTFIDVTPNGIDHYQVDHSDATWSIIKDFSYYSYVLCLIRDTRGHAVAYDPGIGVYDSKTQSCYPLSKIKEYVQTILLIRD
jgi:hypothetical protein